MKSSFDIITSIYKAVNISAITDLIDGKVYKGFVSAKSQSQDIEINILSNENQYLQRGYINVNVYCKQIQEGTPDFVKLSQISQALFNLLNDSQVDSINLDVESQSGTLKDSEPGRDGMFYNNLKIKFNTL